MKHLIRILIIISIPLVLIKQTYAIPPPDFIFTAGSQLIQIFALVFAFSTAIFLSFFQVIKLYLGRIRNSKLIVIVLIIAISLVSLGIAYGLDKYNQKQAYEEWLEESNTNTQKIETKPTSPKINEEPEQIKDEYILFIEKFYSDIKEGNYESAYEVGTKKHDFVTFKSLYITVDDIIINNVEDLTNQSYKITLTLDENNNLDTYFVEMQLAKDEQGNVYIKSSNAKLTSSETKNSKTRPSSLESSPISNQEFQNLINGNQSVFVLDAREDEEYSIGYYQDSVHIRLADLFDGQWTDLPKNEDIYVLCWSGIRGKEVADFLSNKGLSAFYLVDGANGWVKYGGDWEGEISFSSKYKEDRYRKLVTYEELVNEINSGTIVVDAREKERFDYWHIPNSINVSIINTPTNQFEEVLGKVPENTKIITVCDDIVNCFDARIVGIKLEEKGHTFIGRYNKPWEYRNNN